MPTTPSDPAGGAPRWERRKESRPAELLDAALELFVERGYAATRLDDIAARAGVSKGTLYLYFANKEELFKALIRENIVSLIDRFRAEIERSDLPAPALVEHFMRVWWRDFGSTRLAGLAKLVMAEAGNFPEVARFFHDEVIRPNGELFGSILARGVARGEFRAVDVPTAAHLWIAPLVMKAMWSHSFDLCRIAGTSPDPQHMLDVHLSLILAALRPDAR
ncbi:MAG TPA: TetR/AcrR family transcriptional regulator [Burkholderiaceae bacterium]|nr:TetR/AcrR family transcriptional regulator [Burkholderiaceae bacterium]